MLARRRQVRVRVDPGLGGALCAAAALEAEVLLDRVDEVVASDSRSLVGRVEHVGEQKQVLEPVRVVLFQVAAPCPLEPFERRAGVAAVDGGPSLGELAIGLWSHVWNERNAFGTVRLQTRTTFLASVVGMDEARMVLRRLRRIEVLEREHAPARWLLAEVHALIEEAEAWVSAEAAGPDLAATALVRCRSALAGGEASATGRAATMS